MNSTHKVEVVRITEVRPHPNADRLEIIPIWAYTCCAGIGQFKVGDLVAYLPPDSVVDTNRPEFAFLKRDDGKDKVRIKAQRMRGVWSQGLLIAAPEGAMEGQDVAQELAVTHYNPPEDFVMGGDCAKDTVGSPKYDVDSAYRFAHVIKPGEEVVATEKIHGTNARFCFKDGEMHVGSHNTWKSYNPDNLYWKILTKYPEIEAFCKAHEGYVLCGEIYGMQSLKYGLVSKGHHAFAAFDIMKPDFTFMDYDESRAIGKELRWVPLLFRGAFNFDFMVELSQGQSMIEGADHIREGIVVAPIVRRFDPAVGDVKLKFVNPKYLEKAY